MTRTIHTSESAITRAKLRTTPFQSTLPELDPRTTVFCAGQRDVSGPVSDWPSSLPRVSLLSKNSPFPELTTQK